MFNSYLVIPILLGVSFRVADGLKDSNSPTTVANVEAMRVAKSGSIHKYMNESVNPCDDFYQFACGNWRTHHPATAKNKMTHGLKFAEEDYDRIVISLLNETDDIYTESEWKVKNFYDSCLNASELKLSESRQNMKKLIREFGRMPALEGEKWQPNDFDWIKTIGEIYYKYNIGIIYGYTFHGADDPTSVELIMESQLLYEFFDETAEAKNNQKLDVEKNLKQFIGITTKTAKKAAKEIVDFGAKLWTAYRNSGTEQETTFAEMHQKYSPRLDITKLVNITFGYIPDGVVTDLEPGYLEELATIMKKTPKHVVSNYIFYALMVKFQMKLTEIETFSSVDCLQNMKIHFSPILSNMVYRRSHLTATEQEFHSIWHGITTTLQNTLESNQLSWFDDASREAALEKLHEMTLLFASYADIEFEELYKDLTLNSSDFMENRKALMYFNAQQKRKALNERRQDAFDDIGDATPSYMSTANAVRFPLSCLLTDFMWAKYAPHATNYARLGSITGHEIMHGFSGSGRNYNKLGVLIGWMSEDIEESYDERRQCYYDQYHNFTVDNKPMPQDHSQAENLADNGGLYLAYHAYLRWLVDEARTQEELEMETLPHLNYTNKQLFFIGYSQLHCSDDFPDETSSEMLRYDVHSPNQFRAFVPLLNFGEFAKEFNCPLGSPMNPRKKCSIY